MAWRLSAAFCRRYKPRHGTNACARTANWSYVRLDVESATASHAQPHCTTCDGLCAQLSRGRLHPRCCDAALWPALR